MEYDVVDVAGVDIKKVEQVRGQAPRYSGEVRIRITPERQYPAPFELTLPFSDASGLDEGLLQGLQGLVGFAQDLQHNAQLALSAYGSKEPA